MNTTIAATAALRKNILTAAGEVRNAGMGKYPSVAE